MTLTATRARASLRRLGRLGRSEMLLFRRNGTALFNALLLPVALVGFLAGVNADEGGGLPANAFVTTSLLGFLLLGVVYYNLVTTYVARREELVLKRLRTGELTDVEILAGVAVPMGAVAVVQSVLAVATGALLLGLPAPVNAPVLVAGLLGGVVVFVALAALSSTVTRTVEMAQITTLPVLAVCLFGAGLAVPVELLPGPVAGVGRFLPLTPAMELMRLGWLGTTGDGLARDFAGVLGAAARPAGVLAVWAVLAVVGVRRWFRWEPRR